MSAFPFPNIVPGATNFGLDSDTDVFRSESRAVQTQDGGSELFTFTVDKKNIKDPKERRAFQSTIMRINGQEHRLISHDHSYKVPAGSVSVSQLQVGQSNGVLTASWNPDTYQSISQLDNGGIRIRRLGNSVNGRYNQPGSLTLVPGNSYAAVAHLRVYDELQSLGSLRIGTGTSADIYNLSAFSYATERLVVGFTAPSASLTCGLTDESTTPFTHFDLLKYEVARAFLVDNGFNALTNSDAFDDGDWTKDNSSISADATTGPDGSANADELIEDSTASISHAVDQIHVRAAAEEYWTGSVAFRSNTSQRIRLFVDNNNADGGSAVFDATTGGITLAASAGGLATNAYASIHDLENGWFRARVSVRLPSATSVRLRVELCDGASNTTVFSGDGASGLYVASAQLQRGGQLGRYTPTTASDILGANQLGTEVWLKGLDQDVDGQLLAGDQMEINGQLLILQEDLDGDVSGCGLAVVRPQLRLPPADEEAAVLYRPSGRFLFANQRNSWNNRPGIFSDMSWQFVEDIAS